MPFKKTLFQLAILVFAATAAQGEITSTSLRIQGAGLKVIDEAVTASVDLPRTVQTEFAGKRNDEAATLEGVMAVGDLTGPGIETPIQLTTAPGHQFQIPGLSQQGVYYLQNVRLMKGAEFLQSASPATAVITVSDLLQTSVTVKQLSADDLRKRGIPIDARNFDVYEYSFTFLIDGQTITIPFPVVIDPRTHEVQPVRTESPYSLPPQGLLEPPRWSPPQIIAMDFGEEGELPEPGEEPKERAQRGTRASIPAAIVIPNSLAVLHQFFAVAVMVTNGAPSGSTARLEDIKATIKIPTALRTVKTTPQVSFGQAVPIVEPTTGVTFLIAQSRGEAEWTLEGLEPGTHRIDFDLRATLKQEGQIDTPMRATPSAAIVVHDPRFNINFSHPDTVRKGIEYSTYSFITNMSATDQTIAITSGVESCDVNPNANVCRLNGSISDSLTIPAGDMRLIEYRLRAGATGRVFATAGTISGGDALSASVSLHLGVSESGIPLSPATLILPHYAQYVAPEVVSANLQLLGLGYSLATAPLNAMTAKFPRVIRTDVFQRAIDVARAGQRIFITDSNPSEKRDSISHLALDLLGNGGYELREWDQLRRQESSGRTAGAAVMRELEATGLADGATMATFFDAFADATAHRGGFVAALAHGAATGERPFAIALQGRTTNRRTEHPNEASSWIRDIPFSDLSRFNGAGELGELALVARWTEDLDLKITPAGNTAFALELLYPDANDGQLKRAHFALSTGGEPVTITITRGATSLNATFGNGTIAAVGTISTVEPAPLRIAGARQDLNLDPDGHKVSVLFNRPVKVQDGVDLKTKFNGRIDFDRDGVLYEGPRPISAAALQDDGRTVNTTFDHTLSQNATYTIGVGTLIDPIGTHDASFPNTVAPIIDNDAPAGIISGKVVKGDNTPIEGVDVTLRQYLPNDGSADPQGAPQYDVSQSNGAFLFEFVRRQIDAGWSGAYRVEALSSIHGATSVEGSVRLPGEVRFVSLQFLGRGVAQGTVRYNDGSIAANVTVTIGSTMFQQFRTAQTDAQGFYRIDDLPVGPLTFSAKDEPGNVTFAANEIATPGQLVTQNLSIFRQPFPGVGKVFGVVRRSDTNAPMAGVHVGVYSQGYGLTDGFTDSSGRFEFDKIPAGFVSVLAEEWTIARQSVVADLDLKANETKEANLLFLIQPALQFTTLTGEVWREDPLRPGVNERVAGALVKIDGYRVVTADAEGKFTYEELPLAFSGRNITAFDPATQRVKTNVMPTLTEAGPNSVSIFINAFDRGSGKIRVRLLNSSGAPVAGYRVIVPGFPPEVLQPAPGVVGVYELPSVPVGSAREIWAVPTGLRPEVGVDSRPYGDQLAHGTSRVEFNGHIAALTLRLPGEGTVRVKVRSQFDLITPVQLTYPVWFEGEQNTVPLTLEESTEKNLEADRAVFDKIPALTTYSVASVHPQYGYAGATSQLAYDGAFNDHTLQLNTLATVRGTVYAIDGVTPVAGASVTIDNGRSDPGARTTGPDGRFEFTDQPGNVNITVTAQVTQSDIYRIGFSTARTPANGGVVDNLSVVLRKRGLVDGQVVYRDYKHYDPDHPSNNIADDTPNDFSDNAPVPLAKFYLRELDFPNRSFGAATEPLRADVNGRFVINNIFVGALRATGWDANNEELRGDWTGRIDEEGQEAAPKAYIAVTGGQGGVGSAKVTVVDPNQSYAEVPNAEVSVYAGGGRAFDFGSTDATGSVQFDALPVGTYTVSAYSKALGKTSRGEAVFVPRDGVGTARLELEFSGTVDGTLKDPENDNAPVPGSHVRLTASNYQTQSSTDVDGFFLFQGVREGTFALDAKDTLTNRRAHEERSLTVLDPHRTVSMLLEPTETLHFAAYLPDDFGNRSTVLAAPLRAEVVQRCYLDIAHVRHCDYERQLQGNPIAFEQALEQAGYELNVWQPGDSSPSIHLGGAFPKGTAGDPLIYVYPAFGEVRVTVTQAGAPANGAKVTVYGAGNSAFTVYTDATGQAIARNVRLGNVYVQAESIDNKFTGTTSVSLSRQSVPAIASIALGTFAGVTGSVEAEAGGPSIGTRVVANFAGHTAEVRTDANGHYTFLGIPTPASGSTTVSLTFIGPDDTTVGGSTSKSVQAGDNVVTAPDVKLDATAPQIESILPADGAIDVSPDASITITFSEPLSSGTITTNNFQLLDADTGAVSCALTSSTLAGGKFTVTLKPAQPSSGLPLRSNTLYRVIVSGAVTDRTGHPIASTRGFTFTTSDYAEPRVLKVLPANPIPAATVFEFRFNEPIDPAPWLSNGNGAFRIEKLAAPGGVGAAVQSTLVARAFTDPTNTTLFIAPDDVNPIVAESFYRVIFSGVRDPQGNILGEQTFYFFSFDEVAPHVVFTAPPASEQLVSGSEYEIRIELHNGSASGSLATDVKKVDYFTVAANGIETPFASITQSPFFVKILGPEAPVAGASFTVGAQATDGSGNRGPKSIVTWTVKPNAAPANVVITPKQSAAYPSNAIGARVTFDDEGSFASVTLTFSIPKNNGTTETKSITQSYTRLANGSWPEVSFDYALSNDAKAGEHVTITATVADVRGLTSAPASATIDIAADTVQPNILSVTPAADTIFFNTNVYVIEAIVSDAETGVQSVTFVVDGDSFATASQSAGPTAGTQKFRSVPIEVRARAEDAVIPLVVTAKDFNGNTRSKTHELLYKGVNDPDAPKVAWLCPIDKGALPALANNFALKLRVSVVDEDVRSVKFRIGNDSTLIDGALVSGTEYGATHTFTQTPVAGPLTITAIVEDTVAAHTVELPITLDLVSADFTYTDPKAITSADVATFTNKTIVLIGSGAVLAPQVPVTLKNLLVLNGARVETLPTTITREFRIDLTTTGITYVDCDSSVNVSGKGYVGGWEETTDGRNNDPHGRTVGNVPGPTDSNSGPSHGGVGALDQNNSTYGSFTQPIDLGSGGSGSPACCTIGQRGGGAIALRGGTGEDDASRVVIAGDLFADGFGGTGNLWSPGSGGSIWLEAKQVLLGGATSISANGGDDEWYGSGVGGAGGGRVAIAASAKLDADRASISARGGHHFGMFEVDRTVGDAGAGTIYLRKPGQELGELTVSGLDARLPDSQHFTGATPLGRGLTSLAFDKVIAAKRALLVFDAPVSVGGALNDRAAMTIDSTAVVVLHDEQPIVNLSSTPDIGADVIRDTTIAATYTASTIAGIGTVKFTWSPETTPRTDTFLDYPTTTPIRGQTLTVPSTTPLGPATLQIAITDRANRTYAMPARAYNIIENAEPVIASFTVAPGNSIHAGRDVIATVVTNDDVAVKTVTFDAKLNGASIKTQSFTPNATNATSIFTVAVAPEVAGGSTLTLDVTVSDAFAGRAPRTAQQVVAILNDTNGPAVTVSSPIPNATYQESSAIPVRVTAIDAEVAVREVSARFDDGTPSALQLVGGEWRADVTAPPVDGSQNVQRTLTITAVDYANNATTAPAIALTLSPVIDPNAPLLSWSCGNAGAMFPAGTTAKLRVTAIAANAQNPVQTVAMFVEGSSTSLPATSIGSNRYEVAFPIPADAVDGRVMSVRAVATSAGGATADLLTSFTVVVPDAPVIATATTIEATNTTYDNKTLVLTAGLLLIRGAHTFDRLIVLGGALAHVTGEKLELTTTRGTYVACDGTIDVSARGYAPTSTYPGATNSAGGSGGSHLGKGGVWNGNGSMFGSLYRPQEHGGSGNGTAGGGTFRLNAPSLVVDGPIRANGGDGGSGNGAGGSVWITAGRIGGSSVIEANGGSNGGCCNNSAGGGGAVAIEYTDASSTLPTLRAKGGTSANTRNAGAGTVYVKGANATYGDITFDNEGTDGVMTDLPSFGSGTALAGTTGATLVTDRSVNVPAYFVGHWAEITSAAGVVKGRWRIATVVTNSKTVTLAPNGSESIDLNTGDRWQGVYLFDTVRTRNFARVTSVDPIRGTSLETAGSGSELQVPITVTTATINGAPAFARILATNLTVETGASLLPYAGALVLDIQQALTVRGSIDGSGRGYAIFTSYPGATTAFDGSGGSHIGRGGSWNGNGSTFGSVVRPQEAGGSGTGTPSGAALRIQAATILVDGAIRSNGADGGAGNGAGGSVWITTNRISGTGIIEASGGSNTTCCKFSGGGGGALSIEYTDATSILPTLRARGGTSPNARHAGAGSVFVKDPSSTYGSVTIDNNGVAGNLVELSSLGTGRAMSVNGTTVLTDRTSDIPVYLTGHNVDVFAPGGTRRGTWRIASVSAKSFTLQPIGIEPVSVFAGDTYRGVYLFDTFTVRSSNVQFLDDLRATRSVDGSSTLTVNDPPALNPSLIATQSSAAGDFVRGTAGAVTDLQPPILLTATNVRTGAIASATAAANGSFAIAVVGQPDDTFTLYAVDSFPVQARAATITVSGALQNINGVASVSAQPSSIVGGASATGTVRMLYPVTSASTGVVTLTQSSANVTIPATINVPVGASSATFAIQTTSVAADTTATITATSNAFPQSTSLTLLAGTSVLTQFELDASTVEGGTSINGTLTLGAPAPPGGALVSLASSDTRLATVPPTLVIPEGANSAAFTITTYKLNAAAQARITATYGATISRDASLTQCEALTTVAPPPSIALDAIWLDDSLPAGATQSGDAVIDSTQFASGSTSIHLSGAAAGIRMFAFTGGSAFTVGPNDTLVLYALVNPCDPPRELLVGWKAGATEFRASWGESRIEVTTPHKLMNSLPRSGEWTRLEVPARTIGITTTVSLTALTIRAENGEVWIDSIGKAACANVAAPPPQFGSNEQVWFDDDLPAGATAAPASGVTGAWTWSTAQAASGTRSHVEAAHAGYRDHYFQGASETLSLGRSDVLFTYVYLDPCNPPRTIFLQWNDGTSWEHRAYWGENLVTTHGSDSTVSRMRIGPLPAAGGWVRLDVPAAAVGLAGQSLAGAAFGTFDGQAWFDRIGKVTRVNLAYGKTATQSSNYSATDLASRAVDGSTTSAFGSMSVTQLTAQPWWQVDLGTSVPIDSIDIYGRTDCCLNQTSNFFLLVSDEPFSSDVLSEILTQPRVGVYLFQGDVGAMHTTAVHRTGRYVRIHSTRTDHLTIPEVEVWAPVVSMQLNRAGGAAVTASSTYDGWTPALNAVNGDRINAYSRGGSIYHTGASGDLDPWYDVDLGSVVPISTIDLWSRSDCCSDQFAAFYVLVSDEVFAKPFAQAVADPKVSVYYNDVTRTFVSLPVHRTGRYVRMQRSGQAGISLGEIEVWSQQPTLLPFSRPAVIPER